MVDGVCRLDSAVEQGTVALGKVWSGFGAKLRGSGCTESKRGGEGWPAGRTAASSSSCSAQQQLEEEKGDEEHGDVSGRR